MPGQLLHRRWSRLLAAAPCALAVAAVLLLSTGSADGAAWAGSDGPAAVHLVAGQPTVAFLGDSWTAGAGATGRRGYALRTAGALGWGYANFGVGGSGYTVPGPHDSRFAQRIPQLAALAPDVVVVQGSLNERRGRPAALGPAADRTLAQLRSALAPGTPVLVLGASYNPGTPDATIDRINAAVAASAGRAGLPFVDPATADWTDPHDATLWADTIHPTDRGHQLIAERLAPLLRDLVQQQVEPGSPATVRG